MNITVYMNAAAWANGKRHDHNDVSVTVHDHYIRVNYPKTRLTINYPFTSIEKWEER